MVSTVETMTEQKVTCFFFNDTATTEIYTLSLHDALPIYPLTPFIAHPNPNNNKTHVAQASHYPVEFYF